MKPVWGFISILLVTWIVLIAYSFAPFTIKIAGVELKKTHFKEFIVGDTAKIDVLKPKPVVFKKREVDTSKKIILLAGDSMLEQLRYAMYDYARYNGHQLYVVMWYASTSHWWGSSDTLKYFINKFHPNYIILVLGANELFAKRTIEKDGKYIKSILSQADTIPLIWIGPPNWKPDNGINDLIAAYLGYKRFFPSYKFTLDNPRFTRFEDGAHPTYQAAYMWMDTIAQWIMQVSQYPIKLEKPPYQTKKNPPLVVLQPLKN